jgi:hypothetical protein
MYRRRTAPYGADRALVEALPPLLTAVPAAVSGRAALQPMN